MIVNLPLHQKTLDALLINKILWQGRSFYRLELKSNNHQKVSKMEFKIPILN